ncbi:hypothetical protein DFP72DRAFT_915138 [Ephemerocybe angulata]|uniref:Uncharacterized protein n=1 Tax=Ephemerocybe angulata TaxID=980116 RepID=A0A8H6M1M3_9AGAR|nr:hypothetical protein DFP72DRAFT_915138 [Tulosesus angulatus]
MGVLISMPHLERCSATMSKEPSSSQRTIVNNKMPWGHDGAILLTLPPRLVRKWLPSSSIAGERIPAFPWRSFRWQGWTITHPTSPSLPFMAPHNRPNSSHIAPISWGVLAPEPTPTSPVPQSQSPSTSNRRECSSVSSYPSGSSVSEAFWFGDQQGMPYELEPLPPSAASFSEGGWDDTFNFYSLDYNQVERNYEHSESSDLGAQFDQALLFQQQVPIAQYPRASGMPVASESSQYRLAQALDQNQIGNFPLTTGSSFGVWTGHNGFVPVNGGDRTASRERSVQRMAPNTGNPEWPY